MQASMTTEYYGTKHNLIEINKIAQFQPSTKLLEGPVHSVSAPKSRFNCLLKTQQTL